MILGGGRGGKGADANVLDFGDVLITLPITWREDALEFLPTGQFTTEYNYNVTHSILHNATSPHALPAFMQTFFQSQFAQCSSTSEGQKFTVTNHPLPLTVRQVSEPRRGGNEIISNPIQYDAEYRN